MDRRRGLKYVMSRKGKDGLPTELLRSDGTGEAKGRTAHAVAGDGEKAVDPAVVAANVVGNADGPHGLRRCVE